MLKINEEVLCKLVVLLSAQYEEVVRMVRNGEELDITTIPLIQGTPLLNIIMKLSKLEDNIKSINSIADLVEKVSD